MYEKVIDICGPDGASLTDEYGYSLSTCYYWGGQWVDTVVRRQIQDYLDK